MVKSKEELGRRQSAATKRKIAKSLTGSKNPAYKDGRRSYREKIKAKPGQGVHHKDGNSKNNSASNLQKYPLKGPGRAAHEKAHSRGSNFSKSGGRKKVKRGYNAKKLKKRNL